MTTDDMKVDIARRKLELEKARQLQKQDRDQQKRWDKVRKWQDRNHPKGLEESDGDLVDTSKVTDDGLRGKQMKDDGFRSFRDALRKIFFGTDGDNRDDTLELHGEHTQHP